MTIIAACIPILRVFVRDVKTSAQRYYLSDPTRSGAHTATHHSRVRDNVNTVTTITGGRRRDDSSSSTRDEDETGLTRESGRIMQTKEIAIEYQDHKDGWDEHEMDYMRPSHKSL